MRALMIFGSSSSATFGLYAPRRDLPAIVYRVSSKSGSALCPCWLFM